MHLLLLLLLLLLAGYLGKSELHELLLLLASAYPAQHHKNGIIAP
jgi:hypothetical protein